MSINWKLRLKNKATLTTFVGVLIAAVYQGLGFAGIVPPVSQEQLVSEIGLIITLAAMVGIVTDPTTDGVNDSADALEYDEPKK